MELAYNTKMIIQIKYFKIFLRSWAWWHMAVIPTLGKQLYAQGNQEVPVACRTLAFISTVFCV